MFAQMLNGLKGFGAGASGSTTAGAFGAGGQGFLSGPGTAMGGNAMKEFGVAPTMGANAAGGLEGLMTKLQGLTPEQQLQIATQMAQFAAPPPMAPMQAPRPQGPNYAGFMNPAAQAPAMAPQLRTPLGMGG